MYIISHYHTSHHTHTHFTRLINEKVKWIYCVRASARVFVWVFVCFGGRANEYPDTVTYVHNARKFIYDSIKQIKVKNSVDDQDDDDDGNRRTMAGTRLNKKRYCVQSMARQPFMLLYFLENMVLLLSPSSSFGLSPSSDRILFASLSFCFIVFEIELI